MKRRLFLAITLLVAAGPVLAACGGSAPAVIATATPVPLPLATGTPVPPSPSHTGVYLIKVTAAGLTTVPQTPVQVELDSLDPLTP